MVALLSLAVVTTACQFLLGGDRAQCSTDEDCPSHVPVLACVDGLCVEGEADETTSDVGTEASGSTSTPPSTSTTGVDADCDPTSECVPTAPPKWKGPVFAMASDDGETPPCPSDAPTPGDRLDGALMPVEHICDCDCDFTETSCDVDIQAANSVCDAITPAWDIHPDDCRELPIQALFVSDAHALFSADFDACTPVATTQIEEPAWADHVQFCEAPVVDCESGVCMPIPEALSRTSICIWREGEHACPDSVYSMPRTLYSTHSDQRGCSECTCGDPLRCEAFIHPDPDCLEPHLFSTPLDEDSCYAIETALRDPWPWPAVYGAVRRIESSTDPCEPSGGEPTGALTQVGPVSLCCLG